MMHANTRTLLAVMFAFLLFCIGQDLSKRNFGVDAPIISRIEKPDPDQLEALPKPKAGDSVEVEFGDNGLSLHSAQQPLRKVSKAIAERTKVEIIFDAEVGDPDITLEFTGLTLAEGLQRLFQNYDTFLYYPGGKGMAAKLNKVWVYPFGKGKTLKPISSTSMSVATAFPQPQQTEFRARQDNLQANPANEVRPHPTAQTSISQDLAVDTHALLDKAQNDKTSVGRMQALADLAGYKANDDFEVNNALETALRDQDPAIRAYAIQTLASRQGDKATEFLRQGLEDPDLSVQVAAVENANPNGASATVLEAAMSSQNELVRTMAAERLKNTTAAQK